MQLFCPATGKPSPKIYWLKDQSRVAVDENVTNTTIGSIPTIVITIEQKDNLTKYSCIAESVAGFDNLTVNVITLSKPTCICMHTSVHVYMY